MSERPSRPPMPRNGAAAGASTAASASAAAPAAASASSISSASPSMLASDVLSLLPSSSAAWTSVSQVGEAFLRRTGHRFKELHSQSIAAFMQQHPQQFQLRTAANGHQSVARTTDAAAKGTIASGAQGAGAAAAAKPSTKAEAVKNAPAAAVAAPTSAATSAAVSASVQSPRKEESKKLAASPAASPAAAAQPKKTATAAVPKASAKAVAAPAVAHPVPAVGVAAVAHPPAAAAEKSAHTAGQLQPRPSAAAAAAEPAALHAAVKASPAAASASASASAPAAGPPVHVSLAHQHGAGVGPLRLPILPQCLTVDPAPTSKRNPSASSAAIPAAAPAPAAAPTPAAPAPLAIHSVKSPWARNAATNAPSAAPQSFAATMQSQMEDQREAATAASSSSTSSHQDARHHPMSSAASHSSALSSSDSNRSSPVSTGRAHLVGVVNRLTLSWQTSNHDQGRYCGPKQRVIDHIVSQPDFIAAVTHANHKAQVQWSVSDFERLFTVTNNRGFSSLLLPPMFEQLCDLLDQVNLFLTSVLSQPFTTLFDVSTELPAFLLDQCQPYMLVDAATGKETRGHNRLEKHRRAWTFRRYEDLRLGPLQDHPTARSMFRVPSDLVTIPAVRKSDIIEAAAAWLPSGKMSDLVAKGKISEGALITVIKRLPLFRAKIKQAKPNPAQRPLHLADAFSHPHPLSLSTIDPPAPWRCDSCGADASPEETTRFGCAECDVSVNVHRQCVARSPALLAMLPSELVQSLRDEFGPPVLSASASSAPPDPDERYLCLYISPRFDQILRMIKRHRTLAYDFQQAYTAQKLPQLKMEVEARCDALVVQLHKRLASQLSPPEQLYRECTKKVRTLLMEMDFSAMDEDADGPAAAAAMDSGAPANASAAQQRSFRRRQRQIAAVRSHLERVLKLVDAHGHPVTTQSPIITLHRLLVSATPLLIDVVSDRILFVTSPQVVRDAEQKRKAELAESGEQEPEAEAETQLESDEEEEKSVRAPRSHKSANRKAASRSASSVVLEHEDGEALESSEDIVEEEPCPYSEATVRAHMHQLSAIVTPTGPSDTGALLFFTMVRQLQSHMWRAFCSLNPHVDDSAPPSLIEWLESQSIPLQAAVESWAHRRAGAKDGASGSSENAATHLKPAYPASELCQFLMSCVAAMEGMPAWRQWEDAASALQSSDESLRPSPVELILDTPAALQRLNRAVQIHFAVSDIAQLGHGALSSILKSDAARLNASVVHNNASVQLVPVAQLLASSPQFWSPGRISAAAASLPVPVSELVSLRDLLAECTQPSLHHRSTLLDVSASSAGPSSGALAEVSSADLHRLAISALVSVPMLAEAATATHWSLAFEKRLGRIEVFVRANAAEIAEAVQGEQNANDDGPAFLMMQLSAGTMIRLDPRASLARLIHGDASAEMCALQLVSLIASSTSFQQLELEPVAAACHTMLVQRCSASGVQSSVAFVLSMLAHVPEPLRISVCEIILPLAAATFWPQREHGVEPQALLHAALLAEAQRETAPSSHLGMLHALGLQLPVPLWVDSFKVSTRAQTLSDPVQGLTAALQHQSLEEEPDVMQLHANSDLSAASIEPPDTPQKLVDAQSVSEGLMLSEPDSSSSAAVVALSDASCSSGSSHSPRSVIAEIRLTRGVDAAFQGRDAASLVVDAAKNKLLHNALELLSKELYQSSTHFMLESLQNADDNDYAASSHLCPTMAFRLSPTDLIMVNNEIGFREENVRGICGLGNTTKRGDASAAAADGDAAESASAPSRSRIGHKGIGFKSVYVVTDSPQVFSAQYHFQLGIQPDDESAAEAAAAGHNQTKNLGMITPRWIEDADVPAVVTQLKQRYHAETVIRLPLKPMLIKDSKDKAAIDLVTSAGLSPWASLRHQLSELFEPTLLLFLQRVRCLVLEQVTSEASKSIPNTLELRRLIPAASASSDIVEIVESHSGLGVGDASGTKTTHRFLVVTRTVEIPQAKRQAFRWEEAPRTTQLAFAFPLSSGVVFPLPIQPVFAFLPVRPYGFRFLIQGDFLLASSRDSLVESAPRNLWLMEQLPHLMPLVLQQFQRHIQLRTPGVSLLTFFHSLPLSGSRGEADFGCMRAAAAGILQAAKALPCAQDDGGQWAQPKALFFTSQPVVRTLLPSAVLRQSIHHRSWLHTSLERLPVSVKSALGMQEFRAEHVIELLRKACQAFQQNEEKRSAQGTSEAAETAAIAEAAQHRAFIACALQALCILLPSAADRNSELEKLRSLPVFALDTGLFVAMHPDRPILMRADAGAAAGLAGSESIMHGSTLSCRRVLEGSLQIVHADLLAESVPSQSASSKSVTPLQPEHHQLVRKLLSELAVGLVDDHSLFQQAATKLKELSSQPEETWKQDSVREHARATLILSFLHFGPCAHPGCQPLRKHLSKIALVETGSGALRSLEMIRDKLILGQPWTESKLAGLVERLRIALPNELAFETLSGCYLEHSSPASASASASSASPAALDSQTASAPHAAWLSFWRREFGLMELFQVSANSEVMSVPALRADPRCKQTPAIYQMSDRDPEIIVQDFHAPALQQLLEVCSALPITSPVLPLAQIALDELLSSLCDQWSTWKPFMSLRVRRNVTDFAARPTERDVLVDHPSALITALRECAWIPSLRYRSAAGAYGAARSLPPFRKPTELYLADKHNQGLMPLDTPFFSFSGPTDQRACLEAIGIELHVSALQIYHALVSDWSVREGGLVSSLQRMRDVYLFLQQHRSESVEFESESTQSWKLRQTFALHLPDSAAISGGQLIGDLFLESESRNVVWIPLPNDDVHVHDTVTPVLGRFFSPHQCVLNDSKPEILNHVSFSPKWYQMGRLSLFVTKQLYKNGKQPLWPAKPDPWYEPLTRALIAYVNLCVKASASVDGSASQSHGPARDSELTDLGTPRCDSLLVRHLCSWRVYLSSLLSTRYANNADMLAERGNVTVALRTGRLFPCYRLGEDSGVVHFVSLSDQPILVDDLAMAQRFADAGGPLASGGQTLYLLLFIDADDKWSLDAMAHEPAQKMLWTEFGLRKLSQLCERKTIVEVEAALSVPLQQQLRAITRSLQRFLLSNMPLAYRALSPQLPSLLSSYRVDVCRELDVEWQVCGTRSPAQHCSVMHEPEERRICVHARDLHMAEVRVLREVLVEICSLVCTAVPESHRTPDLHAMMVEFAAALLACGRDALQLEQQTNKLGAAKLAAGEPLWNWMESSEQAAAARNDNAEPAPVARRIKGEQYSTRDLFGADAPAPASLPVQDASQPVSGPRPASSAPTPAAASVPLVTPPHVAAALSIAPSALPSPPSSSSSAPSDRDPNAVPERRDGGFGHAASGPSTSFPSNAAAGAGTTAVSDSERQASDPRNPNLPIDWTTSHGFTEEGSDPAAPVPAPVSVPEAVVRLLSAAQSLSEPAVPSNGSALSLAEQMAERAKRLPAPSSNGSFDYASDQLDSQVSRDVGWLGEALCYQMLMHQEAQRQLADPSSAPRAVLWLNQHAESGSPFDLQYGADESDPATELIEVKSTLQQGVHTFDISAREVATALQFQHRYSIWRLTHVGNASQAQLQIRRNPAQAWHQKQIKVTMTL